jgi:hypothetical protein
MINYIDISDKALNLVLLVKSLIRLGKYNPSKKDNNDEK